MTHRDFDGFIPSSFLLELANRNPNNLSLVTTILATQKLSQAARNNIVRYRLAAGKAERQIYDAKNATRLPGTRARFEGDKVTGDVTTDNAYDYHGAMRDFLLQEFGWNSIDGKGMNLVGTVHYGRNYNNAFWNSLQMTYGDGDGVIFVTFVKPNIVGHELAHGVTEKNSGLDYYGEPGANNEMFSDVMGACFEQWLNKETADKAHWLIGAGIFGPTIKGKALRSMIAPGTAYNDPKLGKDPQPDHYSKLYRGSGDNGGVHINSGIPNKAFALFAIAVGGYSWKEPAHVWWETNCGANRVGSNASIHDWAKKTVENCTTLCPQHVAKLKKAWSDVGVTV
jgi:Zn-dependent metalloprotease